MTSEATQAALEPCPFCGSDQIATSDGFADFEDEPDWGAFCKMCEATVCRHTEVEASSAWNTRLTAQSGDDKAIMRELRPSKAAMEKIERMEQANAAGLAEIRNMPFGGDAQSGEGRSGAGEDVGPFHVSQSGDGKKLWFSARDPASGVTIPARDRTDACNLVSSLNHACATFATLNARQSGEDKAIISPLILAVLVILSPFLLPFLAGKLIRKSLKKREEEKKRREEECSRESTTGAATNIPPTLARAAPDAADRRKR